MLDQGITDNWTDFVDEVVRPIVLKPSCPDEVPSEILRLFIPSRTAGVVTSSEINPFESKFPSPEKIAESSADKKIALKLLKGIGSELDEKFAIKKIEETNELLIDYDLDGFPDLLFKRTETFLSKNCPCYRIATPFHITPNITGMYVRLAQELRKICLSDSELSELLDDFEDSLGDMKFGIKASRIKTSIQKQMNLLEGIGKKHSHCKTSQSLGEICDEIKTWPDPKVRQTVKELYSFSNDFIGVRHSGSKKSRPLQDRDLVALTCALLGFSPYLTDSMDYQKIVLGEK